MSAVIQRLELPAGTVVFAFKELQPGDRFRFAYGWPARLMSEAVHTKISGRWYVWNGTRCTTGPNTAVVREVR